MITRVSAIVFVLLVAASLFAQAQTQQVPFRRYTLSDGLSNNAVYAVVQDHLGFMWFGTRDGLNRFDGHSYKTYKHQPDSTSLSHNTVRALFVDSRNTLWVGTDDGLNRYDHVTNTFTRFRHDATNKTGISSNFISSIAEGHDGKLYIGTYGGGVNIYDEAANRFDVLAANDAPLSINALAADGNGTVWIGSSDGLFAYQVSTRALTPYRHAPGNEQSLSGNDVLSLFIDSGNVLWIGTNGTGLNAFDAATQRFRRYTVNDPSRDAAYSQFSAFAIVEDKSKQLWIGTFGGGVYSLDRYTKRFTAYRNTASDPSSLSNNKVRSMFVSRGGTLWVCTERGVNSFAHSRVKFVTSKVDVADASLANNNVNALVEDPDGVLWVGVYGGLNRVTPNGITNFGPAQGLSSDNVTSLLVDGNLLWIGTEYGLDAMDRTSQRIVASYRDNLSQPFVTALTKGPGSTIWIGTKAGGLNQLDTRAGTVTFVLASNKADGLSSDRILSLYAEANGMLWVGTENGLNRYDVSAKSFTQFKHDAQNPASLSNNVVYSITGQGKTIWVGTAHGLNALLANNTFKHYDERHGLPDASVYGVLATDDGTVWISTGRGVAHIATGEPPVVRIYDERDGLQNRYNAGACWKGKNGMLYFGGYDGYNAINPARINHNTHLPSTVITNLKISDKEYTASDSAIYLKRLIVLGHDQNALSFEFAALDFVLPEKNRFMYKLEGADAGWKDAGSRRYVSYTNLDPGTYTFLVSGTNSDNITNVIPASLTIVIRPPFWKTWWFSVLAIVATAFAIYLYTAVRTRRLRQHNKELEEKVHQRTAELQSEKEKVEHKSSELERTLKHLRSTQAQLVQSEKMASLGQLTAGIAHEIKNPLNFVNNFAQLSTELIDEISHEDDVAERDALMTDLKNNLAKINHHGQRADSIVQSMLQHSRGASGEKQPTDLNKLCEEYMDLAFHGMRASVQNFNCTLVKDLDPKLPHPSVVPQEVSRVVLNLLNNAFYAVKEKKDAKVEVSTSNDDGFVRIKVRDNGTGMPENVRNKIFEPFFTTKPAGQGTGLGLSLSFDIVRAHGGEIKVESEAGKGTEFIVSIPVKV